MSICMYVCMYLSIYLFIRPGSELRQNPFVLDKTNKTKTNFMEKKTKKRKLSCISALNVYVHGSAGSLVCPSV